MFSRATLLPSLLVVPLRYQQTTLKPPPKTSSPTVTRSLDPTGSDVPSFIQRRTTDADHHHRQMTTIQIVINGNQVEGEASQIAQILGMVSNTLTQPIVTVDDTKKDDSIKFIDFFGLELDKYIKGGKLFVSELNRCRNAGRGYQSMGRLYHDLVDAPTEGWAARRQLLLTTSAIWRYTFLSKKGGLKYQIAAVTSCDDCGGFASAMVDRMVAEGLWIR